MTVDLFGLVALLDVLTLLVTSLFLVYPVVRHSQNVAYRSAFLSLSLAFFLLTAAAVDAFVFGRLLRNTVLATLASVAALSGTFAFARPHLSRGTLFGDGRFEEFELCDAEHADPPAFEGRFDGGGRR